MAALTSPSWQGVSPLLAVQDFGGWEVPEYHTMVTILLCAYKAYIPPPRLLGHLLDLFTLLPGSSLSYSSQMAAESMPIGTALTADIMCVVPDHRRGDRAADRPPIADARSALQGARP